MARAHCRVAALKVSASEPPSSSTLPLTAILPAAMIATEYHSCSTRSSWWEEKITGTPRASISSRKAPLSASTPSGSRPEKGSSRISRSGSWTSATAAGPAAGYRARAPRPAPRPARRCRGAAIHRSRRHHRLRRGDAVQLRHVGAVVAHPHLRVEAALLRHVADPPPLLGADRLGRASAPRPHRRRARRGRSASSS